MLNRLLVTGAAGRDQLLQEVLAADPEAPRLTLSNTLAKADAQELLDGADDYF